MGIKNLMRRMVGGNADPSEDGAWRPVSFWFSGMGEGISMSATGEPITPATGFSLSPYYAAIRAIAEDVGKLPLHVYKRLDRGKQRASDHAMFEMLHDRPNPAMSAMTFFSTMTANALAYPLAAAEIVRQDGRPVELWPIHPANMSMARDATGREVYRVRTVEASRITEVDFAPDDLLLIHGLGPDGRTGYGISTLARDSVGRAMAAQAYGANYFASGGAVSGVLTTTGKLSPEARQNLRQEWTSMHGGAKKSGKVAVLQEGLTFQPLVTDPSKAQMIESQTWSVEDVARWFRIPPHKIGHLARATFSNIEHQSIEYVTDTLQPWLVRWEHELNWKLFDTREYFAEFLLAGLLRGDAASRAAFYTAMFNLGAVSSNEIREAENMNPVEGGDQYFIPANNLVPLTSVGTTPESPDDDPVEPAGEPQTPPVDDTQPPG